ncbi:rhamnulose-1-phosphate aldolase [Bacteroidia bacterium]|nr:rhamnulose-1-phosphate aldolase [Bacteroidia bacterium]
MKYNKDIERVIAQIAEVAGYLWQRGWAERNGGNISYNITEWADRRLLKLKPIAPETPLERPVEHLSGNLFVVTGTGRRMRYVASAPMENASLIRISDGGSSYAIVAEKAIAPTSELPSHLLMHNYLRGRGIPNRVVVHTHPTELIAMSHNPEFLPKDVLGRLLWSMIPETRAFCPKGVGIAPYTLPGSLALADATVGLLDDYQVVIWEKHGALAVGEDIIEAFDMIDTLSKSAQIYLAARSMGFTPTGMTDTQMNELKEAFDL